MMNAGYNHRLVLALTCAFKHTHYIRCSDASTLSNTGVAGAGGRCNGAFLCSVEKGQNRQRKGGVSYHSHSRDQNSQVSSNLSPSIFLLQAVCFAVLLPSVCLHPPQHLPVRTLSHVCKNTCRNLQHPNIVQLREIVVSKGSGK